MNIFESTNRDTANTVPITPPRSTSALNTPLVFYVVPDFVSAAMRRGRLNTVDISKFGALSNVLTSEDLANWAIEVNLISCLKVQNICVLEPSVGLESYWQTVTKDERCIIQRDILPLTQFPQRMSDVHARLTETAEPGQSTGVPYSFELVRDGIIMHTKPGFLSYIEKGDIETQLTFARQLLKHAYGQVPTYEANKRFANMHRLYVQLLLSQTS